MPAPWKDPMWGRPNRKNLERIRKRQQYEARQSDVSFLNRYKGRRRSRLGIFFRRILTSARLLWDQLRSGY